jgi:hypothetical protein
MAPELAGRVGHVISNKREHKSMRKQGSGLLNRLHEIRSPYGLGLAPGARLDDEAAIEVERVS